MTDNKINDGGPAFPVPDSHGWRGMTLRDYFAAKALAGVDIATSVPHRLIATWCYSIADEMIKAREDKP